MSGVEQKRANYSAFSLYSFLYSTARRGRGLCYEKSVLWIIYCPAAGGNVSSESVVKRV